MRALFISDSPEIWGAERSLLDILPALQRSGVYCTVLAPRSSPLHALLLERGLATLELELPTHPALERGGFRKAGVAVLPAETLATLQSAMRIASVGRRFDVVVSYSLWRNMDVLLGARLSGRKAVSDLHETFEGRFGKILSRLTLRSFDRVISPSRWAADQAAAPSKKVVVVPRIVDSSTGEPSRLPREYTVGMFGQLREHKGHSLLLKALEIALASSRPRALIVGSGGDESVNAQLRSFQARFPGVLDWKNRVDDVGPLMRTCASVLNASSHEAFGRTMYEAVAAGAEPIALGLGGPSEVLSDMTYGRRLNRSPQQLAVAIAQIESSGRIPPDPTSALNYLATNASSEAIGNRYAEALAWGSRR
jgi:glycosyltransferase involved in cell wall biosynthesis